MKLASCRVLALMIMWSLSLLFGVGSVTGESRAGKDAVEEADNIITAYRTSEPAAQVQVWQNLITHPSGNPEFRQFQAKIIKAWEQSEFAKYRVKDPALIALVRELVAPVLRLYRRQNCFEIIVINHKVPIMMNDSGVLLMVSTGLIERAANDDEVLGHVAHELGHDLNWRRTAKAHKLLELYRAGSITALLAQRAVQELAKIELECDAFSAITLASMGCNPLFFGRSLKEIERAFPDYLDPGLPSTVLRARVIESVVPANACRIPSQASEAFRTLKAMLTTRMS